MSDAALAFVGHVGGLDRSSGHEFVAFPGHSGRMLREAAKEAGLDLDGVYQTTVWKHPRLTAAELSSEEIKLSRDVIMRELTAMPNLRVIVVMGNSAMKAVLKKSGMGEKRGEEITITLDGRDVKVLPTFHPHNVAYRPRSKPTFVKDLVRAKHLLSGHKMLTPALAFTSLSVSHQLDMGFDDVISIDAETDENDAVRMIGMGSSVENIYIMPPGSTRYYGEPHTWLGHNIRSDQHWLLDAGIELKGRIEDTMLMAHLLDENRLVGLKKLALQHLDPELYWQLIEPLLKDPDDRGAIPWDDLARYCANDVAVPLILWGIFTRQMADFPKIEKVYREISIPLSNALLPVERRGVPFDVKRATDLYVDLDMEASTLTKTLNELAGRELNWNSDAQVAALLYGEYGITPPHLTKSKARGSVDEKALMKIRYSHPVVEHLVEHRHVTKQMEIIESWRSRCRDGRVYPTYFITGTVTGRISGRNPNPQNVPTDSKIRALIRSLDPTRCILAADYRTIELGVAAWLFEEEKMLAAYVDQILHGGQDLHTLTATALLGRPPKDKLERKKYGKTPNFGLLYQQGDRGYQEYAAKNGVKLTLEQATQMRADWHALYPGIRAGWNKYGLMLKEFGYVEMPSGRRRRLPEFNSGISKLVNRAWREGCNAPVQGTAAELTHVAAIIAQPRMEVLGAHMILHVHDSLLFEVHKDDVARSAVVLRDTMEQRVPAYFKERLGVEIAIPLGAEISVGPSWGEQVELTV